VLRRFIAENPQLRFLEPERSFSFGREFDKVQRVGPNFAGHYAVIEWGGGTGTGTFVIVDVKTGKIFFHVDPL
jgi:hypothetical protein